MEKQKVSVSEFRRMVQEAAFYNHLRRIRIYQDTGASYEYRHSLSDWQDAQGRLFQVLSRWPTDAETTPVARENGRQRVRHDADEDWFEAEKSLLLKYEVVE